MKTLLIILLTISLTCKGQDVKFAVYNIISSSIIAGIGSGIHKHSNETFFHAFGNGCWKGAIGGTLNVVSKELLSYQASKEKLDWKICWNAKLINSISNTIIYNSVLNESVLANYSLNIGFLRLSFDRHLQIEPISLGCMGYAFLTNGKLNVNRSLILGTPCFDYSFKRKSFIQNGNIVSMPIQQGKSLAENILIQQNTSSTKVIMHEYCHTFQRLQYSSINYYLNIYTKYENIKFIHNDLSCFDILYFMQNKIVGYNQNFFEKEANFYCKSNN
jgi:hypothetical protein